MTQEKQHIEDIFKKAFENHEVQPPHNLWDTVETSLNESKGIETVYASTFKNAHIAPSASVWKRISQALFWRTFLTFNSQSFNIYYVGAVLSICGITLYSLFPPQPQATSAFANNANKLTVSKNEVREQATYAESAVAQVQSNVKQTNVH
ncbi:MAG: hypothetical protein LBR55_00470, partial [Bacteroidales bacterium]|nr:hypothetical protein [Bacteroidales bacterium]